MKTKHLPGCLKALFCAFMASFFALPVAVPAGEHDTVRVGYYENEVFQIEIKK